MKIGLIGCGAIGTNISRAIDEDERFELQAVYDLDHQRASDMVQNLKRKVSVVDDFEELIALDVDVIVEAASQRAVEQYGERVLTAGVDLMVMSVGAFADDSLLERIIEAAKDNKRKVIVPSGAVSGIDAIKAVSELIDEIILTTTKHPESLRDAPFFREKGIAPDDIKEKTLLFEGSAREAVKLFPQNVNVAAVISLAGAGWEKTRVRIVADPSTDKNTHEIRVKGQFGEITTLSKNVKSPENPKTSYLAALSAIKTLKNMESDIKIGT
ncbi:MAG: aspartate dehydrogenase [Archaeoglobaceae archaeon]